MRVDCWGTGTKSVVLESMMRQSSSGVVFCLHQEEVEAADKVFAETTGKGMEKTIIMDVVGDSAEVLSGGVDRTCNTIKLRRKIVEALVLLFDDTTMLSMGEYL